MDDNRLDPETEKAVREAMDQAELDVRNDGILGMVLYLRTTYKAFRKSGFSKKQSQAFTELLYRSLLIRG